MTEPHETFTWYNTKPYIKKLYLDIDYPVNRINNLNNAGYMIEDTGVYLARRNKRIAIKRAVYIGLGLIITWGLVWIVF